MYPPHGIGLLQYAAESRPYIVLAIAVLTILESFLSFLCRRQHGSLVSPAARNAFDRSLPRYAGGKNSMCNCGNVTSGCDVGLREHMSGQACFWVCMWLPHRKPELMLRPCLPFCLGVVSTALLVWRWQQRGPGRSKHGVTTKTCTGPRCSEERSLVFLSKVLLTCC